MRLPGACQCNVHPCAERNWPFVYSMDSDSAQLGPSQANLNFCAFDYVYCSRSAITSKVESSYHGKRAGAECAGEESIRENTLIYISRG